jgi:hypothetical protein
MLKRLGIILAMSLCSSAFALNNRSAVSITGSDDAACTVPDPCRTFGVAIAATNPGGEVIVLSSGGYGAFSIAQSVSVIAPAGVHASISPTTGDAIQISGSGVKVVLKGLMLTSLGATYGIHATLFSALDIVDCDLTGFTYGAYAYNATTDFHIYVNRSRFSNNSGDGFYGFSGSFKGEVSISRSEFSGNGGAVVATGGIEASISDSVIAGSSTGVLAFVGIVNIESCRIVGGQTGVSTLFGGVARISNSVITLNQIGISTTGGSEGSFETRQNNTLRGNDTDIGAAAAGHITPFAAW